MKIVMTLMVRDEADIVGSMLEHHFAQGVDHMIVTDNASVDGTTEILESYEKRGLVTLHHDARHLKQQAEVVTRMAREAATQHQATWVLNADADEFWVAENANHTLREALDRVPVTYRAFDVPVIDMIGAPALEGSGIDRLVYRDQRPVEEINQLGLHAHATHDVAFVGDAEVIVAQGNHFVNIESAGRPARGEGIEVLHLPWRSWTQFSTKVRKSGEAYERSGLTPSPNHHGMRDYRRLSAGTLYSLYLGRHPQQDACGGEVLKQDLRLAESLKGAIPDVLIPQTEWEALGEVASAIVALEAEVGKLRVDWGTQNYERGIAEEKVRAHEVRIAELEAELGANVEAFALVEVDRQRLAEELEHYRNSRLFRGLHRVGKVIRLGR